nr:zf-HC2 domain-containing protein [Acanthopleuribacter pedis]
MYSDGRLDEARARQVQDHLRTCRECTRIVLDLRGAAGHDAEAPPIDDATIEAAWQSFVARHPAAAEETGTRANKTARRKKGAAAWAPWLTLAAALPLAFLLGLWFGRARPAPPPALMAGDQILQLSGETFRGEDNGIPHLSRQLETAVIHLIPTKPTRYPSYRIRWTRENQILGEIAPLQLHEIGVVTLVVAPAQFPAGDYELHLAGYNGTDFEHLDTYQLRLTNAPQPMGAR